MQSLEFAQPWFLLLLLSIPLFIFYRLANKNRLTNAVKMPSLKSFQQTSSYLKHVDSFLFSLRMLALALMVIAFARPRKVDISTQVKSTEGVDIMMVVDLSLSMLARDLKPNRIAALQNVATTFVNQRISDRIGLVVYSGEAVTKVPLTSDRGVLTHQLLNLQLEELEPGTAIGLGLATAINHLEHSKAKSKVVLLITDGGESPVEYGNTQIYISPENAAKIAKDKNIKVYTIGIGTKGYIPLPLGYEDWPQSLFQLDESLLQYIAQETNGAYFRATDNQKLESIYNEINQLEKTEINEIKYYNYTEHFRTFLIWAIILLFIEIFSRTYFFKSIN
ncbi:Uncharacterized protein with a von Willebrand factor type A (vWA) domain [Candidatus Ornithobacterium hominis]|uniref:Uncharacterized protein with a von Willebrand factor type A (VWA) domain n=1 Tax=Candidatus Ornithobacterium hominis TaxID=2497989 RepID=A0A383TUC0_9FLAO|nr:VWA domain-containing protein [Candidatus Ornithobacterium hominis]MCT7903902.1 VWA domain-containing protein [Candidatus Ornithobacterium hominis]SZD71244.1 Uncharacterized protein with a von Willebrand factor type A (vWA) domain [Candidatus Ornithobacterium hominis]SZD71921.1 Uncharacterized protein with a von Willebrand factor type A (vWA) domain [Candidatus Ornithobacterium hominis]